MFIIIDQKIYHDERGWVSDVRLCDGDTGEILKRLKTRYMRTTPEDAAHRSFREAIKHVNRMRATAIAYLTNVDKVVEQLEREA